MPAIGQPIEPMASFLPNSNLTKFHEMLFLIQEIQLSLSTFSGLTGKMTILEREETYVNT